MYITREGLTTTKTTADGECVITHSSEAAALEYIASHDVKPKASPPPAAPKKKAVAKKPAAAAKKVTKKRK